MLDSRKKANAKPQCSPCSKDAGKADPCALDELDDCETTKYRSDTDGVLYISSGRFDLQYAAEALGEFMSTPRRLGIARLERCSRYLAGCPHLELQFKHQAEPKDSWTYVDSNWAEEPNRYFFHAGCEFHGVHLVESWATTGQVRAFKCGS